MKIQANREQLLAAFQTAQAVAPSRNTTTAVLQNVKLEVTPERSTMLATDLELGIRVDVSDVAVETPGTVLLPIAKFGQILRETTDETLHLESDGAQLHVRGQRARFDLPSVNPGEFPSVPGFNEQKYHEIPARLLRELIRRTVFATDNESTRYALGGVLLEMIDDNIVAVGTDGRRLAKMEGKAQCVEGHSTAEQNVIVPTKAMQVIERTLGDPDATIAVAARANDILVRTPKATVSARLVEGRFPKWRDVIPKRGAGQTIEMVVGPVYSAVRQAAIATSDESRGIDFCFGDGRLVLSARATDVGEAQVELPIAYDHEEIKIMLDPRFMIDFFKVLEGEQSFTFSISSSTEPAVCRTEDGYEYVIMPLARDR